MRLNLENLSKTERDESRDFHQKGTSGHPMKDMEHTIMFLTS